MNCINDSKCVIIYNNYDVDISNKKIFYIQILDNHSKKIEGLSSYIYYNDGYLVIKELLDSMYYESFVRIDPYSIMYLLNEKSFKYSIEYLSEEFDKYNTKFFMKYNKCNNKNVLLMIRGGNTIIGQEVELLYSSIKEKANDVLLYVDVLNNIGPNMRIVSLFIEI